MTPLARIDNIGLAVRDVAAVAAFFEEKLGLAVVLALDAEPPSATVAIGRVRRRASLPGGIRLVAFRDPEANSFFLVQKL